MSGPFASGKNAIALCDRCGEKVKLRELREQIVKQKKTGLMVCPACLDKDHPQLMLGTFPVYDPQALRVARPDGFGGDARNYAWGWSPVGGGDAVVGYTPNPLAMRISIGTVTVVTS